MKTHVGVVSGAGVMEGVAGGVGAGHSSGNERGGWRLRWVRLIRGVAAIVASQSLLGAVVLTGWVVGWMRRTMGKAWAGRVGEEAWETLGQRHVEWKELVEGPRWLMGGQREPEGMRPEQVSRWSYWLGGLGRNLMMGIQMLAATWAMTLPGCVLIWFSWYAGWQNSFNKGYEDAWVGPATGVAGIACFVMAMIYVPMAQARLASTGEWRRFFEFRLVGRLIRRAWLGNVLVAVGYGALSVPWLVAWLVPGFLPQINPALGSYSEAEVGVFLRRFYLVVGLVMVPALMGLRMMMARVYARALVDGIQRGGIAESELSSLEWRTLNTLGLLRSRPVVESPRWRRVVVWLGTTAGTVTAMATLFLIWFGVIGQVYVAQFFVYRGGTGWLNHPLIQLPWLH